MHSVTSAPATEHRTVKAEAIRDFWTERARQYKTDARATLADDTVRALEIRAITKYLHNGATVLDAGCGNGYSTIQFARRRMLDITGIDYSSEMVRYARENLSLLRSDNPTRSKIRFAAGDVMNLSFPRAHFDTVITERCLQNLPSWEDQRHAILNLAGVLKPQGVLIMAECSFTGLDQLSRILNALRRPLADNALPWHNLFFCDECLINDPAIRKLLAPVCIVNFASSYAVLSRLLPVPFQFVARWLARPSVGPFSYHKLYLWRRRG